MLDFNKLKYGSKENYTLADVHNWAQLAIHAENTELGWAECSGEIGRFTQERLAVLVEFGQQDAAPPEDDKLRTAPTDSTLSLQYFFPSCDQALLTDVKRTVILVVLCHDMADQKRVQRYLSAMNRVKKRLCICTVLVQDTNEVNSNVLSVVWYDPKEIGALLPLLCIGESQNVRTEDDSLSSQQDLTVSVLSKNTEDLSRYIHGEFEPQTDILDRSQKHILQAAMFHTIDAINREFLGESTKEESIREREQLCADFWSIVTGEQGRLHARPLLTQVIWLLNLRYLLKQKELQNNLTNPKTPFRNDQIFRAMWDAVAYSEGILQLLENSEQHSQHHMGYLSIYIHNVSLNAVIGRVESAQRRKRIYYKYRFNRQDEVVGKEESCCVEFNVTDMGRDKEFAAAGVEVCSKKYLSELFSGDAQKTIDDSVHHYGLPLFFRTVMRKCGRFICTTPQDGSSAVQYIAAKDMDVKTQWEPVRKEVDTPQPWTGYQILLPLSFRAQKSVSTVKTNHAQLFDASLLSDSLVMPSSYTQTIVASPPLSNLGTSMTAQQKMDAVKQVCKHFEREIGSNPFGPTIYCLEVKRLSLIAFEIYLKGFFRYIAQTAAKRLENQPLLLFRLTFTDEFAIGEALRRFAIFYNRLGTNKWMRRVQIALCGSIGDSNTGNFMDAPVRLVLAGENVYEAYITAKQYMYYNANLDNGFLLGQVEYLAQQKKTTKEPISAVPLFPFDLVKGKNGKSSFVANVEDQLNKNLQNREYGCKIENAHIRLGSKIHISDFYDAELLFQSVANVYRFAYLLAEQIITAYRDSETSHISELLLIGYESYSSLLVSEVKRLVESVLVSSPIAKEKPARKKNLKIDHLQFVRTSDDDERIVYMGANAKWEFDSTLDESHRACVIILPIGTTLSTIYKIRNIFQRQFKLTAKPIILRSYALIVVGNCGTKNADGTTPANLSDEYWKQSAQGDNTIILTPESSSDLQSLTVHYLFYPKSEWMRPDACRLCGETDDSKLLEQIPLGQVDKTSTIPRLIFPIIGLDKNHGISFSSTAGNPKRLKAMQGCIDYGHIQKDSNHYQFYIRYNEYYRNVRDDCIKWLDSKREAINENEFHIIVSPLQYDNSLFVKDVIDHVFQHSLRFIYVSLDQAYREEFRSRFSYIAKEYQDACAGGAPLKYNVYYVDYSLVSGQSLRRADLLVRMLLSDANIDLSTQIFRKVILLTNRSSYDTAAAFVDNPKTDFIAFSTLQIPSYNTLSNHCPACELIEVYQEIAKCCATNELYWYYHSLTQKHQLRSPEEHKEWLESFHFTRPQYLQSFCQALLHESSIKFELLSREEIIVAVTDAIQKFSGNGASNAKLTLLKVLEYIQCTQINTAEKTALSNAVMDCYRQIIDLRNWRRLICTHEAMRVVENGGEQNWDYKLIRKEIWNTIQAGLEQGKNDYEKREWLISYIKVFSREYPAKVAPVRRAIFSLLELLMHELLEQNVSSVSPSSFWQKAMGADVDCSMLTLFQLPKGSSASKILQMYQLYMTLAKRLCGLQSNRLLRHSTLKQVDTFLVRLNTQYNDWLADSSADNAEIRLFPNAFPSVNKIQSDYLRVIKWAAMSSREDAKAFLLRNLSEELIRTGVDEAGEGCFLNCKPFGMVIRQENTRMLYSGIKRLDEHLRTEQSDDMSENWNAMVQRVKNAWEMARIPHELPEKYLSQNPMADLFRFLHEDLTLSDQAENASASKNHDAASSSAVPRDKKLEPIYLERLAALIGVYRTVIDLCEGKELEERKDYGEKYLELCVYMSKIADAKNCCIVHQSNGENQIISQYFAQGLSQTAMEKEVDRILSNVQSDLSNPTLDQTVCAYPSKTSDGPVTALVLTLQIQRRSDIKHFQKVCVVLFNAEEDGKTDPLRHEYSHYLLFMRQRMQMVLERDLYALHHFKTSLEDVSCISNTGSNEICILHLTDLHISTHNEKTILELVQSNRNNLVDKEPDLMVVTGDIVQGNSTAVDLEANYRSAAKVLKAIAETLWSQPGIGDNERLRADWKKRIIIIPGNHDYASMNELTANHTLRVTTGGVPVLRDGSPMSKYSYFIQFLQDFLGIDSQRSIQSNLNALLEYPQMKLRFIALNSVAEVGPLRNNKVQLDKEFIESLPKGKKDGYFNIALVHHTRCYMPDYFHDRYWVPGLTDEACALAKTIIRTCLAGKQKIETGFVHVVNSGGHADPNALNQEIKKTNEKLCALVSDKKREYEVLEKTLAKSAIFSDVSYVREHWSEITNERCNQIFTDYQRCTQMSIIDLASYLERLNMIEEKYEIDFMLGGHTHRAGRTDEHETRACVEGPRFYSEDADECTRLSFGRLLVKADGTSSYEFSHKKMGVPIEVVSELPIEYVVMGTHANPNEHRNNN